MIVYAKTESTWNYWHIRLINPSKFVQKSFRSHDVGRSGHSIRIAGILKSNHRYATQAWRLAKTTVVVVKSKVEGYTFKGLDKQTQDILQSIRSNNGRIKVIGDIEVKSYNRTR